MSKAIEGYDPPLGQFEGWEIGGIGVAITNAGDGLSKALSVDPIELHLGDTRFVVLRCDVTKIVHQPMPKEEDKLIRVHTLRATDATIVDADLVQEHIDSQRDRIIKAREEADGIQRLGVEFDGEPSEDPF